MRTSLLACPFIAATLLSFGLTQTACLACNDIGCAGGFEWSASVEDEGALPADEYSVRIDLEGTVYEASCTVVASAEQSSCADLVRVEGEGEFSVELGVMHLDPSSGDSSSPASGFFVYAVDVSGSDDGGNYSENRGPSSVDISISSATASLLAVDYQPEYERDEAYRGDSRCGFCDRLESITETFAAPV